MRPTVKGVAIAAFHLCLVALLGGKLLYDRATLPSVWVRAVPHDPSLPIRGRYVSLDLIVHPQGVPRAGKEGEWRQPQGVALGVEGGRLVARPKVTGRGYDPSSTCLRFVDRQGRKMAVLSQPVPFFIPEHVPDPSQRPEGEELWVLVTLPQKGPPRPIRLGVRKVDGSFRPLDLT